MALKRQTPSSSPAFSFIRSLSLSLVYSPFCFCTHERSVNGSDVDYRSAATAIIPHMSDNYWEIFANP